MTKTAESPIMVAHQLAEEILAGYRRDEEKLYVVARDIILRYLTK